MLERHDDMWEWFGEPGHLVCISTNGTVKRNGEGVMGRGCAREATRLCPGIQKELGSYIKTNGNVPGVLYRKPVRFSVGILPVKHNWWEQASLDLIRASVEWLQEAATMVGVSGQATYHVPRLGCGHGRRDWNTEVQPLIVGLPDNVWVHSL